jgi:hypothetical protein
MIKDEWRITSHAIQLEMERIAGLLQKSARYYSRGERSASHKDPAGSCRETATPEIVPLVPAK